MLPWETQIAPGDQTSQKVFEFPWDLSGKNMQIFNIKCKQDFERYSRLNSGYLADDEESASLHAKCETARLFRGS